MQPPTISYYYIVTFKASAPCGSDRFDHLSYTVTTDRGSAAALDVLTDILRDRCDLYAITETPFA